MRSLEASDPQRQKAGWKGQGWEGDEEWCLMGAEFEFGEMRKFWGWTVVLAAQQNKYA